ncbi:MAG TPA: acyltransferase [Polyangia bacterium]|nr:acyltransferase [Polyangia bacterium]
MLGRVDVTHSLVGRELSYGIRAGWVGVQLFFVLSGFLITGILLDTQKTANHYSGFFARRLLRILPLYYAVLVVAFLILPLCGVEPATIAHDRPHQFWLWAYLSNWTQPFSNGSRAFPHFWSLGVEEQFYLVWPFLLRRKSPRTVLRLCLALVVAALGVRIVMLRLHAPWEAIYTFSISRMDALALGGAIAAAFRIPALAAKLHAVDARVWIALIAVGLGLFFATGSASYEHAFGATVGYSLVALICGIAIIGGTAADAAGARGWFSPLRLRPLRVVGKYSYGMYVFHKPFHDFIGRPIQQRLGWDFVHTTTAGALYIVTGMVAILGIAFVSYNLFERRFLKLKERFAARPLPTAEPAAMATQGTSS